MRWLWVIAFTMFIGHVVAQPVTIMSYNCENLFDTLHDAGHDDLEFLPEGTYHWSRYRMFQKLRSITQVITAADTLRPIDIVCLQEVENDTIVSYLTRRTALNAIGYEYLITNSADHRGIDVALLYSPYTVSKLHCHPIQAETTTPTRHILYASLLTHGHDTLDIYVLHLPSRLGGRIAIKNRESIVKAMLTSVDSLQHVRQQPNIIILGDMNEGPQSKLTRRNLPRFVNLADMKAHRQPHYAIIGDRSVKGSYKYQGKWENIDQILISPSLTDSYLASQIIALPFMLEPDIRYGGMKPRRTYVGYTYNRGTSDHLPVVLRLQFHK